MVAKNYVGLSLLTNALEQVIVLFMFSHTAMGITEMWKPSKMLPQRSNLHDKTPPDVNKPPPTIPLKSLENDYKMISRLGDGGFGIVRLAKYRHDKSNLLQLAKRGTLTDVGDGSNVNLSPLVAIKTMNARLPKLEHYTRVKEVQFIQAMPAHINLLHIYEVFIDTSQYCLHFSMECMDQTLYGLMRSRGGKHFTASTVRSILWQLLSAISHIHDHGYFHRDIKPQNILISSMLQYYGGIDSVPPGSRDQKYMVKLADYGLARHVENCKDFTTYISTRWYRAPEMLLRRKWHSTPVDIWAFGTVAAEVAKVTPLFPGANEIDQIWRIFKVLGNPAPPKNIQARPFPVGGYWVEGQLLAGKCGYSFPEGTGIPIDEFIPHSYPFLCDMIRICLRWNPETRPIASELYDQSYFMYTPEKKAMETSLFKRSGNVSLLSATAKESVDHSNISPIETYDFYKVPPDLEADMDNYGYMDLGNNKENLGPYDIEVDESQIACQSPRTDHTNNLEIDEAMNPLNPNQLKGASSEEHPEYPFVLLSNRDEYYRRPTEPANLRSYDGFDIVSPLDLGRPEHGTWIGISSKGKIAVLVNYREDDESSIVSEVSRGILPIDYLMSQKSEEEWLENIEVSLAERTPQLGVKEVSLRRIGGFSLLYGHLRLSSSKQIEPLHILSNRGDRGMVHARGSDVAGSELRFTNREEISSQTTFGLSNSLYYNPWKKVELGRKLLLLAVERSVAEGSSMEYFVDQCFEVLSHNTYSEEVRQGKETAKKFKELQNSIFIPPIETGEVSDANRSSRTIGRYYGTRTQTVILLRRDGKLFYCERNLHKSDDLLEAPVTNKYSFDLQ